jgi:hypothetical protein
MEAHLVETTVLLNEKLLVEELHLKAYLLLLEGLRKTNWLEKLGAFLLSLSYQNRLDEIEALHKKGVS